jgi:hypothetical protein
MNQQLVERIDFYYDEHGYIVLTEKYHLEKGFCCGHGCMHCPYTYENVPEPKRAELMKQKND